MKIIELLTGINLPITNEEAEVLALFDDREILIKSDLAPRTQLLVDSLVNKDVLIRRKNASNKSTIYTKKIR